MAITHSETPLASLRLTLCARVRACVCVSGAWMRLGVDALPMHSFAYHRMSLHYLVSVCFLCVCVCVSFQPAVFSKYLCKQNWMFPCWRSLFVLFICIQQSACWRCWSLQVAGIRSLVIRLRANWVALLRMVCWRLSQNYPWIIPQNYAIPVRHCPLMEKGRGRVLDEDMCVCTHVVWEIWMEQCWCLCHGVCISVCVHSVMILAVLVHWGNGAC